jgi:hypothetical protein
MKVEGSVVVGRAGGEVFTYLCDFDRGAQWAAGVMESRTTSDGLVGLGATVRVVGNFLGERLESNAEVVVYEPGRRLGCKSTSGPVPYLVRLEVDPLPEGVRVTGMIEADAGFFRLAGWLVRRTAQRQLEHDLETMKDILEARELGPGPARDEPPLRRGDRPGTGGRSPPPPETRKAREGDDHDEGNHQQASGGERTGRVGGRAPSWLAWRSRAVHSSRRPGPQ